MRDYKDDMKPFLKKFCSMHLFQRFVERDLFPKTMEDQWEAVKNQCESLENTCEIDGKSIWNQRKQMGMDAMQEM